MRFVPISAVLAAPFRAQTPSAQLSGGAVFEALSTGFEVLLLSGDDVLFARKTGKAPFETAWM